MGLSDVVADGKTEAEAIANVKSALTQQLVTAKVVKINVDSKIAQEPLDTEHSSKDNPSKDSPWIKYLGVFEDDPTFDDFLAEIEDYRKAVDEETSI